MRARSRAGLAAETAVAACENGSAEREQDRVVVRESRLGLEQEDRADFRTRVEDIGNALLYPQISLGG